MYQKIMVPLDGSELAESVLPHVDAFMEAFDVSRVILVRVVEPARQPSTGDFAPSPELIEQWEGARKSAARDYLDEIAERLKHEGASVYSEVIVGRATESLVDYAERSGVDLFIIATHGRSGITRWVLGSVAEKLLRSASIPVLMVRASGTKTER